MQKIELINHGITYHSPINLWLFILLYDHQPTHDHQIPKGLFAPQKRVIRIMSRSVFDAPTAPLFKESGILNVEMFNNSK